MGFHISIYLNAFIGTQTQRKSSLFLFYCFLQFVLKHEKYFELREVPEFPNSLNPRVPGSLALLKDMLAQVMKLHPEAQHFHIGCDEVRWDLGNMLKG